MKDVKIVGFVSEFHYHDFVDQCEERGILLAGVYDKGEFRFQTCSRSTVEFITSDRLNITINSC